MRYGVDSHIVPTSPATYYANLKAAGRDFVGRYLASTSKGVTDAEITAAATADVDMFVFYELSAKRANSGTSAGTADATAVLAHLTELATDTDVTTSCPVYYTVDFDAYYTPGGMANVKAYFEAVVAYLETQSLGVEQVGAYGGAHELMMLHDAGLATYYCQALAWQYGHGWLSFAQLRQTAVNYWVTDGTKWIYNDKETAIADDFGQFRHGATPVILPSAPVTIPITVMSNPSPLGLLVRSTDELQLIIKDDDGNAIERRGTVATKQGGLAPLITVRDPAAWFDKMPVEWDFNNVTIAEALREILANPTGKAGTGWVLHIEETTESGVPLTLEQWNGRGKSVATVLADFQMMTGARWCFESRSGVWHFYWGNPANFPTWVTLRDDIDFSEEDADNLRVLDNSGEIDLQVDVTGYANRVRYPATVGSIGLLPGMRDWDEVWTEDTTRVRVYDASTTLGTGPRATGFGDSSLEFTCTYTAPGSGTITVPDFFNLGYLIVPGAYVDMTSNYFGWWYSLARSEITNTQGIAEAKVPRSLVTLKMALMTGAYPGPSLMKGNCYVAHCGQRIGRDWTTLKWQVYGAAKSAEYEPNNVSTFDLANVSYIALRAQLANPTSITALEAGESITWTISLDHFRAVGAQAEEDAPTVSQHYVETEAVSSGYEIPIEARIEDVTMSYTDATALATLTLAELSRPKVTVPGLQLPGIVNVPLMSNSTLNLTSIGVEDVSYPLAEVTWSLLDSGDVTSLTLGDLPADDVRKFEALKHHIDRSRAQG